MGNVPATEFKAKCLELMDRVAERSESFVITKRGKPVAKLVPVVPEVGERLFGALRGLARQTGDIVSPVSPGDWTTIEEWDELEKPATRRPPNPKRRRAARHK